MITKEQFKKAVESSLAQQAFTGHAVTVDDAVNTATVIFQAACAQDAEEKKEAGN